MEKTLIAIGQGDVPALADDFSLLTLSMPDTTGMSRSDGLVRLAMFGIRDCGGPGAPAPGAVTVANIVLTTEKARQLAKALMQHVGGSTEPNQPSTPTPDAQALN